MPRKSLYDYAALAVVAALILMMLSIFSQMLTCRAESAPEAETEDAPAAEASAPAAETRDLLSMTRAERDPLRDRDGCVWGIKIDWAALYPPKPVEDSAEKTAFELFAAWIEDLKESTRPYETQVEELERFVDDYATDLAPNYHKMVVAANSYDAAIGWDIADIQGYNPVIMAEDNYFITCVPRQDQTERAEEIVALRDYCAERGMAHLHITTPNDACRYDEGISGVLDFYNQNADRLQRALRLADVDTMDLRDDLHAAGLDHHECFYQTDHHWTPQTGRWAAGVIAERLNADYGFDISPIFFEPERWREEVYEGLFLGSQGKKVTLARAKPEDFILLRPKFVTHFHVEIPSLDVDKSGDFFSAFYRYNVIRLREQYEQSPYATFFFGDQALTRVHNEMCANGKRVLVLGHSFDNVVLPFLALGIEYLDSIDLREFKGSIETFLDENHYDLVIELYTE